MLHDSPLLTGVSKVMFKNPGSHRSSRRQSCLAPRGLTLLYVVLELLFFKMSPRALGIRAVV